MPRLLILPALGLALLGTSIMLPAAAPAAQTAAPDGAAIYKRCAACHTATGAGIPGAYPPLGIDFRNLAATTQGRRYIALAVLKGVTGPITVEGRPYRGVMPAQSGLNDASVAAVLNHVGTNIARTGPRFRAFTSAEIAGVRGGAAAITGADVGRLHGSAGGK